jgi:glutaredoxin
MKILVLGGAGCRFCELVKKLLIERNLDFDYRDVREDELAMEKLKSGGFRTIPQIWADDKHIGGYTELHSFLQDK